MPKRCGPKCRFIRSFRYGFDGNRFPGPFDRRDRLAGCAKRPEVTLVVEDRPPCVLEEAAKTSSGAKSPQHSRRKN